MKKFGANVVPIFTFLLFFCLLNSVIAAESTEDVSADAKLKAQIRQEILGETNNQYAEPEYIVGYRDILHISVYGEGSMSTRPAGGGVSSVGNEGGDGFIRGRNSGIEVRLDGRISLRHIGDVSVVGMTLTQIADYLKKLYGTIYDNPSLTVTLEQSNSLQYTVMGQVGQPGLFHLDYPVTIVKAVARAGGFTEWANFEITVIRQNSQGADIKAQNDKSSTHRFDYEVFLKGKDLEKNIPIKSGDVIVVH